MSESIVRKVQPFTIGTKLSVPSVPKCPDFTEGYLPSQALDNCKLRHNLNNHVSLFLGRAQVHSGNSRLVPPQPSSSLTTSSSPTTTSPHTTTTTTQVIPAKHQQQNMAEEDHLNRNAISPGSAASRSIRKITISSSPESNTPRPDHGLGIPRVRVNPQVENNNNNNNITTSTSNPQLPRIVGVSCENKPSSHFKVLLRKDSDEDKQNSVQETRGKYQCVQQTPIFKALSLKRDLPKGESPLSENKDMPPGSKGTAIQNDHCFAQRNALFNKEISQAEAWIKGKLRDLKDGCNIQRSPLTDCEEVSQTLQRDLKDFENTLIQLNQMGEQLMCKTNPTSDLVKKQLSQVRDQWQTLKQTAANQTKALGGAKNLHEFNRKVERLEAWIKEKEEEQSLANLLGENIDKMQLTRRILDLKQDEQLYRNLHEEINHLALKLEKQGKTEGRNISSRRKHINKMWLKVQSLLKDYHENLQLALDVSSFYQQADNIMCAINNMRRSISASPGQASGGDGEIRDIASQIMMLDVTVSQLSNLHPSLAARVTQKQGEVKDCWALLQKAVRSEKPAPPSSHFAREDSDPATPSKEPQCSVGTPAHRLMGKEVKEEQNRLKGCAVSSLGGRETATTRALMGCSLDESGQNAVASEVIARPQTEAERKQTSEEKQVAVAAVPGTGGDHPQLHTQLQKFTVSADKTLSWLKDNVAMATQICYTVGSNSSFEAAKRCQAVLEQDILCNRARIELVKKEGRSLVRAQHPGSAKIKEFLGQLEVLWEELKKQHQRNVVVLQASEELNFRAVTVLQALSGLETWLEVVETSIRESSVAGDPESMSLAERESCLLENELSARGLHLQALRCEVDTLRTQRHLHTELLPARIQEVERKYQSVQSALTQQSSELQDTRMLTEFLERVELEEDSYSTLGEPLHSEIASEPSLLAPPAGGGSMPLLESIGNPVEELREAVVMLNDTARERGRSVCQDQAIQELLSRHASVSVRVEQRKQRASELAQEVQVRESEMAVRCVPERSGLKALQEQQQQLQAECTELKEDVEAMEGLTSRLEELCPERLHVLGAEVQATLGVWRELGRHMEENQGRLRQFGQLRDFFRNYLAMISWTEDTRSYIFSESAKHQAKDNPVPVAEMLDLQIEQKFNEFDELSAAAKKLIDSEHHLTKMIKERMEELRSMLGWILVHWRAQKAQWKKRKRRSETKVDEDAIYTEATVCSSTPQVSPPQPDPEEPSTGGSAPQDSARKAERSATATSSGWEDQATEAQDAESGYEVMNSVSQRSGSDTTGGLCGAGEKPNNSHLLVLKEPGSPSQRGTVNLILSFNDTGDSQLQVQEPESDQMDRVSEPIHRPAEPHSSACKSFWKRCQGLFGSLKRKKKIYRHSAEEVSTFLHVKDNTATGPVYESMSLPRLSSTRAQASVSSSYHSPSSSSTSTFTSSSTSPAVSATSDGHAPQVSSVSFHTLPRGTSSHSTTVTATASSAAVTASIFSSLKRRSKKRKKKRDARRHTIQRIMGVEQQQAEGEEDPPQQQESAEQEAIVYDTHTWPLKERRKRKNAGKSAGVVAVEEPELTDYVKNPLLSDIDAECSGELRSVRPISQSPHTTNISSVPGNRVKGHCRFLSLGSVLSFELPKDVGLIPCIPDVITIAPPESRRTDPKNQEHSADRSVALSTFKLARSPPTRKEGEPSLSPQAEAIIQIQLPGNQEDYPEAADGADEDFPPPPSPVAEDLCRAPSQGDLTSVQLKRLSGVSGLHEEAALEWDKMAAALTHSESNPRSTKSSAKVRENELHSQLSLCEHGTRSATEATVSSTVTMETPHVCPSVHTLIKDLNGHKYHWPSDSAGGKESPVAVTQSHTSHMVLSFKASGSSSGSSREDSVDSGHSSSGSFKFCVEAAGPETPDDSLPRRAIGRVRSVEAGGRSKPAVATTTADDPVHPDHQQFEEEEEELEDIWNQSNGYRQSVCSDIMYQGYQEELSSTFPCQQRAPSPKEQAVIYRKLVTASAPNLLVAEFRLPPSIQGLLGYGKDQSPKDEAPALGKRDRRSWAAFSHQDQSSKQATLVLNETASYPVRLPEMEDHKYIYQYKEEEEEEEEVERQRGEEGEEVDVDTGCPKDLLSVHMGLDGPSGQAQHCTEDQGYMTITGGRCSATNGQKPEFPSMEGTLERKHRLQPGGKKAPCRTWNTYHAILYRQTLSFYIDRKDTLRSSASSLPLNLAGAECVPVPEYAKKPNCFSLRLCDGSEYLLSASSRFMMKKWMLRIHANTGSEDAVPSLPMFSSSSLQDDSVNMNRIPSLAGYCIGKYHCPARDDVTSCFQTGAGPPQESVLLNRDGPRLPIWHQGKAVDISLSGPISRAGYSVEDAFDSLGMASLSTHSPLSHSQDWLSCSNKRRSHSFTSATYQRIRPVRLPPSGGSQDSSSNYSVTLFIGDQPSMCNNTEMPQRAVFGSGLERPLDLPLRNYASLPRPRNKSVFKKFFSKKE
ncbi:uncharacterized protein LOC121685166 isoform X3 [Alosa sapidissima]|uniref:uncharacterized protein LOC121685166 isoform X3 n=1 Tax=Alosa sapidissima TaxID=34773 RepID=UPI001C09E3AF|nr:uncharacterized protein LOC121685166 isoform X3 [Alosa sapidissima]